MAIRISNIRLGLDEPEEGLLEHVSRLIGIDSQAAESWRILRKSLDSRDKRSLCFVYSVELRLPPHEESRLVGARGRRQILLESFVDPPFEIPAPGSRALPDRPVVVGSGPAGLVAAWFLAEQGYQPLLLERGRRVRERIQDVHRFDAGGALEPESNYLFGEGGAGTFSDGKLTCRNSGPDVRRVLELLAECKGKPSILYDYRPHLGSNRLPAVVKALRQRIERHGGEIRFSCRVEDLEIQNSQLRGVITSSGHIPCTVALLATGHSARDVYRMLLTRGIPMTQKAFQMGVRVEQPQETVNRVQYGSVRLEEELGAADYSLIAKGSHDLFTFCMCAGGNVIPSVSEPGYFSTNGMSLSRRDSRFANSGLMITIEPHEFGSGDILAGVHLQEIFEQRAFEIGRREYLCPIQRASDFLADRPTDRLPASSYSRGLVLAPIADLVPASIRAALIEGLPQMDHRWHGRFLREATLVGPEARGSSPVRIERDPKSRESPGLEGLYPVGEGAGYAGGIVSAAVDGLRSAKAVIRKYAPIGS